MIEGDVRQAASRLAPLYGKPFGVLTSSGMAAIELALDLCGVVTGDEVVVPAECCFRVPAAVLKHGARPVFAATQAHQLDPARLNAAMGPRTRAVIAVHHFGLPCRLREIRELMPVGVALIEDAAQAFDLSNEGAHVGLWSDFVVSSFSTNKPMSLDGGGGVFGSLPSLTYALDGYGPEQRMSAGPPRSFPLHPAAVQRLEIALAAAALKISRRRSLVRSLSPVLESAGLLPWSGRAGDLPCWHRLPLFPSTPAVRRAALEAKAAGIAVELPHDIAIPDLPMFAGARRCHSGVYRDSLLIRLDNHEAVKRWAEALVEPPRAGFR